MTTFGLVAIAFIAGGAIGYTLGWNLAAHPGKVEGQAAGWWALIKAHLGRK